MITAITTILGAITGILPGLLRIFEKRQDLVHERELLKLRMEALAQNVDLQLLLEESKASYREGESLRIHDSALDGGKFINTLRASVRPIITYIFFFMFVIIKGSAAYVMLESGMNIPQTLAAIWDEWTLAIFGSIMGFWFGARQFEKMYILKAKEENVK